MPGRAWRRSWCGAGVSSALTSGRRRAWRRTGACRRRRRQRISGWQRALRSLLGCFGQLHGPGSLLAGVDFEKAGAVKTASEAIFGTADSEFLLARAHESLTRPLTAAIVIDG